MNNNIISIAFLIPHSHHRYGALSFWDYAAAGPYVKIEMNPPEKIDGFSCHKDAIFISPHKFPGGPGTPGVLIAKKQVFLNTIPTTPGGGTVQVSFFVVFLLLLLLLSFKKVQFVFSKKNSLFILFLSSSFLFFSV